VKLQAGGFLDIRGKLAGFRRFCLAIMTHLILENIDYYERKIKIGYQVS